MHDSDPVLPTEIPMTPLTGVRGWLLFFVIVMFFNALLALGVSATVGAGAIVTLPLFGVALAAGIQLVRKKKSGVLLAKIFLYANCGVAMLAVIIAAATGADGIALTQSVLYMFRALLFGGIWLAYLYRSKRVANTYGV